MSTNFSENSENLVNEFICQTCDFVCSKRQHFKQHCNSKKHIFNIFNKNVNIVEKQYICSCGKKYKERTGLWKHKKHCGFIDETIGTNGNNGNCKIGTNSNEPTNNDVIMKLIESNAEWQTIIKEIVKNGINNSINNQPQHSYNNNNNKTFNLQVYLNEKCKNAMNLSEFVESIIPSLEELENTGREGYVKGISDIVLNRLDEIDATDKPIHCSDKKREILHVKENNIWNRESEEKPLLTNAIKKIAHKNMCNISEWSKKHPDCTNSDSRKNDLYLKIVSNSMSGINEEECLINLEKIISNIAKNTLIDKI